jgi:hypothetical protein
VDDGVVRRVVENGRLIDSNERVHDTVDDAVDVAATPLPHVIVAARANWRTDRDNITTPMTRQHIIGHRSHKQGHQFQSWISSDDSILLWMSTISCT